jgi:hypothetical protein
MVQYFAIIAECSYCLHLIFSFGFHQKEKLVYIVYAINDVPFVSCVSEISTLQREIIELML